MANKGVKQLRMMFALGLLYGCKDFCDKYAQNRIAAVCLF